MPKNHVRYAVVGLGYIAQIAVLPAFRNARRNSELAALVTDDPKKARRLSREYDVPITTDYDGYDRLLASGAIDAVYVALPNSMHRDFAVRAARAGVHVLCEKPLAVTSEDCLAMIRAAERDDVRLMTAYRLHFEHANLRAVELVEDGRIGEPRFFSASFGMNVADRHNIRLQEDLGGGTLYDLGIYCLNAARSIFKAEPEEVFGFSACGRDRRFREVDEMTGALLRFPDDRLATLTSSFGSADVSSYEVVGTEGSLRVDPAYEYAEALEHRLKVGDVTEHRRFARRDQFGPELVYFSNCVLAHEDPEPSGWEGLADVRVIEALYRSARTGRRVSLPPFSKRRRPEPDQEIRRPPVERPDLVHARPPSGD
jgi:glucose-fructose oxidoreductase